MINLTPITGTLDNNKQTINMKKGIIKIIPHSIVDVITNSSTEIYTWQNNSVKPCKEMLQEFLTAFEIDKTFDDLFYVNGFCDIYTYKEYLSEHEGDTLDDTDLSTEEVEAIIEDVLQGKIQRPDWIIAAEESTNWNNFPPQSYITIKAKDPKYDVLTQKIEKFLSSPENVAVYNG